MWTVFLWIYVFFLAFNGAIIYIDSIEELPFDIVSPLDTNSTISNINQPALVDTDNITGNSTTLIGNLTGNVVNQTDSTPWDFLVDNTFFAFQLVQNAITFLTGGFVFQAMALVGLPDVFIGVLQGIVGFFLFLTIVHFWTGRF